MAKRVQGRDAVSDAGVELTPEEQLAGLENLPPAPPSKSAAAQSRTSPASPATKNPSTAAEAMGPVKEGYRRVVMAGFDPLHTKGRPGASAQLFGAKFVMDPNGDLVGDMPDAAADAYVATGRMVYIEDHHPAASRDADDIERARRAGRVLRV